MPSLAIIDCDLLTPARRISHGLALVAGGVIRAVGPSQEMALPAEARLIDARGGWITPGLIDLAWRGPSDLAPETFGVTSYVSVVSVQSEDDLPALAQAAVEQSRAGFLARPLGLHVILGADPPAWDDLWAAADAAIALVTLSPALPAAPVLLPRLLAERIPCIFDWPDAPEPPAAPLVQEMLACGLAATNTRLPAPYRLAWPGQLSDLDLEGLLLASSPGPPLRARELYALSRQNRLDFGAVLAAASAAPARFLRLAQGRLAAGAPADLLCWTRFGELAWAMVAGETRGGGEGETREGGDAGREGRREGVGVVAAFLRGRRETVEVAEDGVDLVWRYRLADGQEETATIAIQTDEGGDDRVFRFEAGALRARQADWYFYHFPATGKLYCLPARGLRAWLERHPGQRQVVESVQSVTVAEIMAALPRARLVEMGR